MRMLAVNSCTCLDRILGTYRHTVDISRYQDCTVNLYTCASLVIVWSSWDGGPQRSVGACNSSMCEARSQTSRLGHHPDFWNLISTIQSLKVLQSFMLSLLCPCLKVNGCPTGQHLHISKVESSGKTSIANLRRLALLSIKKAQKAKKHKKAINQ